MKPTCTKCKGSESPSSVERLNAGYWICHECLTVFKNSKIGRPTIGKPRQVKITLPDSDWQHIEALIASGRVASYAEYFRDLHASSLTKLLEV
ncbi:hypothetical protein [Paenibacillus polymyxa]|uniref:hypothetical protein n=1 Tax=Paenibacillus polymyxa TaxID=1406 RepID=UPI00058A3F08|nr:hypothetical protein [Paenibacillus polymyxa]AJE54162.1 hypothetical protein RE92_24420 [Paenibacillus polymyxa]